MQMSRVEFTRALYADVHGGEHGQCGSEETGDTAGHLSVDAAAAHGDGRVGQVHTGLLPTQPGRPGIHETPPGGSTSPRRGRSLIRTTQLCVG